MFKLPLMNDNIDKEDIKSVLEFLSGDSIPKLTNGPKVVEFENSSVNLEKDLFSGKKRIIIFKKFKTKEYISSSE
jgi:hypothetical protein